MRDVMSVRCELRENTSAIQLMRCRHCDPTVSPLRPNCVTTACVTCVTPSNHIKPCCAARLISHWMGHACPRHCTATLRLTTGCLRFAQRWLPDQTHGGGLKRGHLVRPKSNRCYAAPPPRAPGCIPVCILSQAVLSALSALRRGRRPRWHFRLGFSFDVCGRRGLLPDKECVQEQLQLLNNC